MSFAVSIDGGRLEYAGSDLAGLLAQPSNLVRPRFYAMMTDLLRFYRQAPRDLGRLEGVTLADYLDANGYGRAFREDHLYPMAAAIWSTPATDVGAYPAEAFIRFCDNHGLLKLSGRPQWRTVKGGSRAYVAKLAEPLNGQAMIGRDVKIVERSSAGVVIEDGLRQRRFDKVLVACHADQALGVLKAPTEAERQILGAFRYSRNYAVSARRRAADAAPAGCLGGLELSGDQRPFVRPFGHLLDEPAAAHRSVGAAVRHAQSGRRAAPRPRLQPVHLRASAVRPGGHRGAAAALESSGRQATSGSREPISARGSTRMACKPGSPPPRRWAHLRRPWLVKNESGRIHLDPDVWGEAAA